MITKKHFSLKMSFPVTKISSFLLKRDPQNQTINPSSVHTGHGGTAYKFIQAASAEKYSVRKM
jgi:hypothetical protein